MILGLLEQIRSFDIPSLYRRYNDDLNLSLCNSHTKKITVVTTKDVMKNCPGCSKFKVRTGMRYQKSASTVHAS